MRAQLNGFSFYLRVLQPWARDPAFYKSVWMSQSDTPAHEGPTHHAVVEVWTYDFPLSDSEAARFEEELRTISPLLEQARGNLTGNARDLWITGTGTMQQQVADLEGLARRTGSQQTGVAAALAEAAAATRDFVSWLESRTSTKTGPSGLGKDDYTWSLQNVHLIPKTWDDEVALLERELDRAHAALRLEEHRNRNLPLLVAAQDEAEFAARADAAATKFLAFLGEQDVLTMADYLDPAQRAARGLASLYAHANEFDIAQAKAFQVKWTPRGWMDPSLDLLGFEQQLYLRQPGYGTSYVTGKALIDNVIRERAAQLGDQFTLRGFFDEVNAAGMMPVSLLKWQLTGEPPVGRWSRDGVR